MFKQILIASTVTALLSGCSPEDNQPEVADSNPATTASTFTKDMEQLADQYFTSRPEIASMYGLSNSLEAG